MNPQTLLKQTRTFFDTFFPVPKVLSLIGPGIEISEDMIRVVTGYGQGKKSKIIYHEKALAPGIVLGGEVQNVQALTVALRELDLPPSLVRLSIPDEKVFLFDVTIPQKEVGNPDDAILFRLEENVPVPIEEALFEWRTVGRRKTDIGEVVTFSAAVIPQGVLRPFLEAIEALGHTVIEVVPKTLSIANAAGFPDTRPWLLLYVGRGKSSIAVVTGHVVRYSTVVPTGMTQIADGLSRVTKKTLPETEAELALKGTVAFEKADDVSFTLAHSFSGLKDEVAKVVAFWNNQSERAIDGAIVEKVYVTGVDVSAPGILDLIASGGPISYALANPWNHLTGGEHEVPGLSRDESLRATACLGLLSLH